jgi:hypothetical protein
MRSIDDASNSFVLISLSTRDLLFISLYLFAITRLVSLLLLIRSSVSASSSPLRVSVDRICEDRFKKGEIIGRKKLQEGKRIS